MEFCVVTMRTDGILCRHYEDRWNSVSSLWEQMNFLFVTMRTDKILRLSIGGTDGISICQNDH